MILWYSVRSSGTNDNSVFFLFFFSGATMVYRPSCYAFVASLGVIGVPVALANTVGPKPGITP